MNLNFIKSLLKDKYVLYIVLFFAVTNLFGYLMLRDFDAVMFFLVVGFLSSYFSKNMIIVLLIAMLSTNFLVGTKLFGAKIYEGMTTKKASDAKGSDAKGSDAKGSDEKVSAKKAKKAKKATEHMDTLAPANINDNDDDNDDNEEITGAKPKVNFASTLESAYDNLDKLLSSEAINKMTSDTQRLAEKQKVLMGNIDKLGPMMNNAQNLLQGLDVNKMGSMIENMQEKMSKFTGNGK
jgi:hypothetical protein